MSSHDIPVEVRAFVERYIESYGLLQVLLLLAPDTARSWTHRAIAQELRTNDQAALKHLNDLCSRGLAELVSGTTDEFRFIATTRERALGVSALLACHSTFHSRIIALIYERPPEKLRAFADAFKIRKDDDNNG